MRRYNETIEQQALQQPQPAFGLGQLVAATFVGSAALGLVTVAVSWVASGGVWWEAVIVVACILPLALSALMVMLLAQTALQWWPRRAAPLEGDDIRLIPVHSSTTVEGIEQRDLAYFVRTALDTNDWTQRAWRGKRLPSGRKVDNTLHSELVDKLTRFRIVEGYGPRTSGQAVMGADEALKLLGLAEPPAGRGTTEKR